MKICLLTLYLNHFNENKLVFRRTLKKLFLILFYFFCGIVKFICELRHTFLVNLRPRQILILRLAALLFKSLRSATNKFANSPYISFVVTFCVRQFRSKGQLLLFLQLHLKDLLLGVNKLLPSAKMMNPCSSHNCNWFSQYSYRIFYTAYSF